MGVIEEVDDEGVQAFMHDGGEAGVMASFLYRADGAGWVYFSNSELGDDELDALYEVLEPRLRSEALAR